MKVGLKSGEEPSQLSKCVRPLYRKSAISPRYATQMTANAGRRVAPRHSELAPAWCAPRPVSRQNLHRRRPLSVAPQIKAVDEVTNLYINV